MKRLTIIGMLVALFAPGGRLTAEMCTIDVVPAATLLLPYFEVDLDDPNGATTLFSINNALPDPALTHLIMWSDLAAPLIDFDIFLTGYDIVTVDLRDMIENGNIPITADEQSDSLDTISPHGKPEWDGSFTGCAAFFPWFTNPMIQGTAYDRLYNGTLGNPVTSLGGRCLGADHGDNVARGYVTIDNTTQCCLILDPGDITYFVNGGLGIASNVNQLWGDYFIVDPSQHLMVAQPLVHIEAHELFDGNSTNYTFYGRYVLGDGRDDREPLGTLWGVRYLNDPGFIGGTELIVWRDTTADNLLPAGAYCDLGPDWQPLPQTNVVCFDEAESYVGLCAYPNGPTCFPLAAQKVRFGAGDLTVPFDSGWCYLNLNIPEDAPTGDVDFPLSSLGVIAQSWVGAVHSASGLYASGLQAVELAHACEALNPVIHIPEIFADGFESGDTSGWSSTAP